MDALVSQSVNLPVVALGSLLLAVAVFLAGVLVKQHRLQARRLDELTARLNLFAETSINVARSVDRASRRPRSSGDHAELHANRRWLMQEALRRGGTQQDLDEVEFDLGLVADERRLLERARGDLAHALDHRPEAVASSLGKVREQV